MSHPGTRLERVRHMVEAIDAAVSYVAGLDKPAFAADKRTQQAVVYNLLILGEAATHLSQAFPEFVAAHPSIPWTAMRGMRNRMAHGYFEIDLNIVWDTVQNDLPALRSMLAPLARG